MGTFNPVAPDKEERLSPVPRILVAWVSFVCAWPRLFLSIAAILCSLSIYLAITQLNYQTSRDDLMNPNIECQRRWRAYLQEFGQDDDIVVVIQGNDQKQMIAMLEQIASRIRQHSDKFDRLFYKVDLRQLQNRALLYLPLEEIKSIAENLTSPKGLQPLLEIPFAWQGFSLRVLLGEAHQRVHSITDKQLSNEDRRFLKELLAITRSANRSLNNPKEYHNPWSAIPGLTAEGKGQGPDNDLMEKPRYFFSDDQTLAFLLVRAVPGQESYLGAHAQVSLLRQILNEEQQSTTDIQMGLTGLPVLEVDEMLASKAGTENASWMALIGVTLLYVIVFRTWRWPFYTVSTLVVGALLTLGWLTLTVGHLNLLSATFAVMIIGMGDYGILWVARYMQERDSANLEEMPRRQRILEALRITTVKVGPSIVTASLTTGLAFFAVMLTDFQGMAELGWIAGCGVMLCAISCFTVLPALLLWMDAMPESNRSRMVLAYLPDLQPWPIRRSWRVLAIGTIMTLGIGYFAFRINYDQNLLNLQARGLDSVHWEETLLERTSGASWHAVTYTDHREQAIKLHKKMEQLPEVSRVIEIASLIPGEPSLQREKASYLQTIQQQLRNLPRRGQDIQPQPWLNVQTLPKKQIKSLQSACQTLMPSLRVQEDQMLLQRLSETLNQFQSQLSTLTDRQARDRLLLFDRLMVNDLSESLHQLRDVSKPGSITLDDLPAYLKERYLSPNGKWLLRVFAKNSLWEEEPLTQFVHAVQQVDPQATGKPFTTREGLKTMKVSFQWAGLYALIAIVIVLSLDFRAWLPTIVTLIPLVSGALLALGVMTLLGWNLNPANMIALPLLVGVGVDNGVHVVHDYLTCRKQGRPYRLSRATGKGILVAGLTTMLGFGALTFSPHRGLAGMGLLLTLGVGCCMAAALLLLPALLHLRSVYRPKNVSLTKQTVNPGQTRKPDVRAG